MICAYFFTRGLVIHLHKQMAHYVGYVSSWVSVHCCYCCCCCCGFR